MCLKSERQAYVPTVVGAVIPVGHAYVTTLHWKMALLLFMN